MGKSANIIILDTSLLGVDANRIEETSELLSTLCGTVVNEK